MEDEPIRHLVPRKVKRAKGCWIGSVSRRARLRSPPLRSRPVDGKRCGRVADRAHRPADKTIADFGEQWTAYRDNSGHYASTEYLFDIVSPLLTPDDIRGSCVADIGSGSGRIVLMLLDAGAALVHAVEPSQAFDVLRRNTADFSARVALHNVRGEQLPAGLELDLVVSIGVIHHIPDPAPTLRAAFAALRGGGRCLVWLYGHEGNERYLAMARPVRSVTTRLPHAVLALCVMRSTASRVRTPGPHASFPCRSPPTCVTSSPGWTGVRATS